MLCQLGRAQRKGWGMGGANVTWLLCWTDSCTIGLIASSRSLIIVMAIEIYYACIVEDWCSACCLDWHYANLVPRFITYEVITLIHVYSRTYACMKQEKDVNARYSLHKRVRRLSIKYLLPKDTFPICMYSVHVLLHTYMDIFIGGKFLSVSKKRCINMIIARG